MKLVRYAFLCCAAASPLAACGSDDGGADAAGTLLAFTGSDCKKESAAATGPGVPGTVQQALSDPAGQLVGLSCIGWSTGAAGQLTVELTNVHGACGAEWEGRATVSADGALELGVTNPRCLVAACGWCLFDWAFEVAGVELGADLDMTLTIDTCPGEQDVRSVPATIPLSAGPDGVVCRYTDRSALDWHAGSAGACGTLLMPCREAGGMCDTGDAVEPCEPGLACTDLPTGDRACLQTCAIDDDCPAPGVLTCQQGACQLASTW